MNTCLLSTGYLLNRDVYLGSTIVCLIFLLATLSAGESELLVNMTFLLKKLDTCTIDSRYLDFGYLE